jgi:exosortase A-associated hydrolase 1
VNPEIPVVFYCGADRLVGILHTGDAGAKTAVVITVGGPQYRVGSHRQFVLMARHFAAAGIPVLRFDYRGMGDSDGVQRSFEAVDQDIRAAINCLTSEVSSVNSVILLGLCDAASANIMYAPSDNRVAGLILLNPWVRTTQGEAKTYLRHYYLQRVLQKSFWRTVFRGEYALLLSVRGFFQSLRNACGLVDAGEPQSTVTGGTFLSCMRDGFDRFQGSVLILISGNDLTAQEFVDLCQTDKLWNRVMERPTTTVRKFPQADNTMSAASDLQFASETCVDWLTDLPAVL